MTAQKAYKPATQPGMVWVLLNRQQLSLISRVMRGHALITPSYDDQGRARQLADLAQGVLNEEQEHTEAVEPPEDEEGVSFDALE